jgi:deoxyribose-phosphate aldolase
MDENGQTQVETYESLSTLIDYHALQPEASSDDIAEACRTAAELGVRALVVRPIDVEAARRWLGGSGVAVSSVAGYPDGISTTATKLYELRDLLRLGAKEAEFVLSAGKLLDRQFQHIEMELLQASRSCAESGAVLKVVCNNRFLPDDVRIIVTKICRRVEAAIISVDDAGSEAAFFLPLLKDRLLLKRANVVETLDAALAARAAGYSRIATSTPAAILDAWKQQLEAAKAALSS